MIFNRKKELNTLIVDSNVLLKRSFNGAKNLYIDGVHIGGLFQFYTTLRKHIIEYKPDRVILFWDGNRSSYLRIKLYSDYKGNRPTYIDTSFETQKLRIKQYAEELFLRQYEDEDCEADDLISYYTQNKKPKEKVTILTVDRDLLQLLNNDVNIYFFDIKKNINVNNYNQIIDYDYRNVGLIKILEGCNSDNIKGVKGINKEMLINNIPDLKNNVLTLDNILEISETNPKLNNILKEKEKILLNEKLIDLSHPLLTNNALQYVEKLIDLPLDVDNRSMKNVIKMMNDDGFYKALPKTVDSVINFLEPFSILINKEKKYAKENENI
jgi:5'-3' exonuclease